MYPMSYKYVPNVVQICTQCRTNMYPMSYKYVVQICTQCRTNMLQILTGGIYLFPRDTIYLGTVLNVLHKGKGQL
jgi:hypothetical protein